MIDKLRELRDGLISTNEEIMELQKTIEEKVNEAIAECTDELDKQINRFDTYQNIL
jgi:DNA-binding protein H-NS